jgi:hypothetical protein
MAPRFAGWLFTEGRWQIILRTPNLKHCRRRLDAWALALHVPPSLAVVNRGGKPPDPRAEGPPLPGPKVPPHHPWRRAP